MTTNSPGSRSVRARKNHVAEWIDDLSQEFSGARIASVACGHLRELTSSTAFQSNAIGEFVAVDQDAESISFICQHYPGANLSAYCSTLKQFLGGRVVQGTFDGVYAAGLLDYFDDQTAIRAMVGMLRLARPGGRVLIANLTPGLIDIGYMEAIMDWWLVYRTEEQLRALAKQVAIIVPAQVHTYQDVLGNVAYAALTRD